MKISKALLTTITVAVAATALSSCTKEKIEPKKEVKTEVKTVPTEPCPACGMG